MPRQVISSGSIWEERVGYARAVRVGDAVFVAGTTATDERGDIVGKGDIAAQARYIVRKIGRALEEAGASLDEVVRWRAYVTDISQWERVAPALREAFGTARPASTMVEVSGLVHPDHLIEIEVDALIGSAP